MNYNKKIVLGITLISIIFFILVSIPSLLETAGPQLCYKNGVCQYEQFNELLLALIPALIAFGVIAGAFVYYFLSEKVQSTENSLKHNTELLLKFLNADEKMIVSKLIEGEGKVLQSEVSRLPGLGKVKSHRTLKKLVDRGVVVLEQHGKTNIVRFAPDIKKGLF